MHKNHYLPLKSSFFIEDQVFIERREENKANIYEFLQHSNNFTIFFINHVKRKSRNVANDQLQFDVRLPDVKGK